MELIPFSDIMTAIRKSNTPQELKPFALKVVTLDVNRNTGGDILDVPQAIQSKQHGKSKATKSRTPKHFENQSINIQLIPSGEIRKIHPRLIIEFNNKKVFY